MKPLISVIIPVYNVEKYIAECLESVRVQSFRDYEVVIVNDGTKDKSAEIAQAFICGHDLADWKIVHKDNGGLSSARNFGMQHAQGEWVLFVDSDDWLTPNALQLLAEALRKNPSDLIIGGYQAVNPDDGTSEVWSDYPCEFGVMPEDLDKLHSFSFCWGRLYKKSIIDEHGLLFDERIEYAEDNAWQFDYLQWITSFSYTHELVYNYRINRSGSLTSKLISPQMKQYNAAHMYAFYEKIDGQSVEACLKKNPRLLSVTWGVFTTDIVNNILSKQYRRASAKRKSDLSRYILQAFQPRSKKEWVFLAMYKASFLLLCVFVKIYYGNFEKLRTGRFISKLSVRKK